MVIVPEQLEQVAQKLRAAHVEASARWDAWKDIDRRWQEAEAACGFSAALRRSQALMDAAALSGDGLVDASVAYRDSRLSYRDSEVGQLERQRQEEFVRYRDAAGIVERLLRELKRVAVGCDETPSVVP